MNINMVAANICKWAAWGPCRVTRIHGWNNNAFPVYIQLHETPPLTYNTNVPTGQVPNVKSFLAQANNGFDYEFGGGISLAELTIACSSAELSFTAAAAGLDMTVELDTVFDVRAADRISGDLTTTVNSRQVWANSSGPQVLLRVDFFSDEAFGPGQTATYMMLFADTTNNPPTNGTKPIFQFACTDNTGTVSQALGFGDAGIVPQSGQSTASLENVNKGCLLALSTTPGTFTAISDNALIVRAIYRPS